MRYRPDIDGLRAIAVLLVLIFHFGVLRMGGAGFIGVDIFFVISGYLILRIMMRQADAGEFSLRHFYARRVRRLAPALIATQVAVLAVGVVALMPIELLSLARESLFVQLYLSNFYYFKTLDYFGLNADSAVLLHTWSLGVEEQFYIVFPLLVLAVRRISPRAVYPVLALVTVGSFALNLLFVGAKPQATFYLLPTRAWEMGIGALLPLAEAAFERSRRARTIAAVAAPLILVAALAVYRPTTPFPGWYALMPTAAGSLFLLSGIGAGSVASRLLATRVPVAIGRISYPLYLVHWPLYIFGTMLLPVYGPAERWASLGLSFVLAAAIYRWVEQPIRTSRAARIDRKVFASYAAATAAFLVAIGAVLYSGGWRQRFSPAVLAIADAAGQHSDWRQPPFEKLRSGQPAFVAIGTPGATPHWLIYGDSHVPALATAIDGWLRARGEAAMIGYQSACAPLLATGSASCRAFTNATFDYLRRHPGIGRVLMVSVWLEPTQPGFTGPDGRSLDGEEAVAVAGRQFGRTIDALRAIGVQTVVWEPVPVMPARVPQTVARNLVFGRYRETDTSLAAYHRENGWLERAITANRSAIAGVVRPADDLCRDGTCPALVGGRPLYSDDQHPAAAQAGTFERILTRQTAGLPPAEARRPIPAAIG